MGERGDGDRSPVRSQQDEREGYHLNIRAAKHVIHNQFEEHVTKLNYDYFKHMQCDWKLHGRILQHWKSHKNFCVNSNIELFHVCCCFCRFKNNFFPSWLERHHIWNEQIAARFIQSKHTLGLWAVGWQRVTASGMTAFFCVACCPVLSNQHRLHTAICAPCVIYSSTQLINNNPWV